MVDLRMPKMDGLEVLSRITAQAPDTPVIVASGAGVMDDAIQALRLGAWDYLLKPISNVEILHHTLERSLERSRLIRMNDEFRKRLEEKLELIQDDATAARRIQYQLMPPPQAQCGPYHIQRSILSSLLLSGDFLDYFEMDRNHLAFYAADVSGHRVSSALVTVMLKSFMNTYRNKACSRPSGTFDSADAMTELNPVFIREKLNKHVAMFFGILNTADNTLNYCSCGQFPYPILHQNGKAGLIDNSRNLPIGMIESAEYSSEQIQLPDAFRLNIFSDGALELLDHTTLDEKVEYLMTLNTEQSIRQFFDHAKNLEELPDDISILSIGKDANHG